MKNRIYVINITDKKIEIDSHVFLPKIEDSVMIEMNSVQFQKIRTNRGLRVIKAWKVPSKGFEKLNRITGGNNMSSISIFNKHHFPITVGKHTFPPYEEVMIQYHMYSTEFRELRSNKSLRVGKFNNDEYKKKHYPKKFYEYNMVYDVNSQHKGSNYTRAIEALAMPIINYLPESSSGFVKVPVKGFNLRFFSSKRIMEQGKYPVGPNDIFMSHGIGDKDYWIAENIENYKFALVPGQAWKERLEAGGYKGEIFVVGYTKLDPIFKGEYEKEERNKPYVVWAPTHGYVHKHKGRSSYPQCLTLVREIPEEYETKLALHPTSKVNNKNGKKDVTMQELVDADVIIGDAGSTLYEAWAIGKPVIFPDWICKNDILAHFKPGNLEYEIYDKGIGYHAKNMKHMIKLIDIAMNNGMKDEEIEFMESVFPAKLRGNAGETAAEAIKYIVGNNQK